VLRMDRVHEADDVVFAFVLLELFVLGEKRFLGLRVRLAGHELWLLINEKQGGHAAGGIGDAKLLLDPGGDLLGREVQMR
jgi:hypothetical protein